MPSADQAVIGQYYASLERLRRAASEFAVATCEAARLGSQVSDADAAGAADFFVDVLAALRVAARSGRGMRDVLALACGVQDQRLPAKRPAAVGG